MEEESIYQTSNIDIAELQRSQNFLEKVKKFEKLFKEIQQSIDFNREHFTVLLECMEYHERIGTAEHAEIIDGIMEIACDLLPKGGFKFRLFDELKDRFIKVLVSAMNTCKQQAMVQKRGVNILSLLARLEVLGDHIFDVAKAVMQSLDVLNEEESEVKAVEMITYFPRYVSREENALLGNRDNIKKFLRMLERKLQCHSYKPTFSCIIGALIGLTDDTPTSSINLVDENGLDLFDRLLQDKDIDVEVKISTLLLVGNMAEVSYAQKGIIKHISIILILLVFLMSKNMRMSFISAEALAQLSDVSESEWAQLIGVSDFREKVLQKLYDQVMKWESVTVPMNIRTRTFRHLYRHLQKFDSPATQLYAAWAIRYYCLEDGKTYKEILIKEEGFDILTSIKDNDLIDSNVKKILHDIFLIVR